VDEPVVGFDGDHGVGFLAGQGARLGHYVGFVVVDDDEFSMLADNLQEVGLDVKIPSPRRRYANVGGGRRIAAIIWGESPPEIALLHGGAQNAHTWDNVALALQLPVVAVDLPGHGRSDWHPERDYSVRTMSVDVAEALRHLAPKASMLVGIGLGAPIALGTADVLGPSIDRLVMVDSVAGVHVPGGERPPSQAATNVAAFTAHERFDSFEAMLNTTMAYNPGRTERSLRRGLLHNAHVMADGSWTWRWDPAQRAPRDFAFEALTEALGRFEGPVLLVRGEQSDVVTLDAVDAFKRQHSRSRLVTIAGGHHAVQGNRPLELAQAVRSFRHEIDSGS